MVLCTVLAVAALLSSCHGIYNDLEPCSQGVRLRFVYDYNMEYANAFHSQVDCLALLVYDEQGNYLVTYIGTGDELKDENYRMTLDLEKGSYHFIAYGGLTCPKTSFSFKAVPGIGSIMQDLRVEMHNAGRVSETDLHPLFHGSLDMSVDNGAYEEATVYLMKNTNNIRVVLQQMNGGEVDDKNFTFRITDDNTLFAPDNSLISNGGQVYAPWTQGQRTVGVTEEGDETVTVAYAEFSTSRLVAGNHTRLTITRNSDNAQVLNIPLNEYLLPIIEQTPPPSTKGKYIRIKYVTQLASPTPAFAFFVNLPQYIKEGYRRFLENKIRERWDFKGVPIQIFFRQK